MKNNVKINNNSYKNVNGIFIVAIVFAFLTLVLGYVRRQWLVQEAERQKERVQLLHDQHLVVTADLWKAAKTGNVARFEVMALQVSPTSVEAQEGLNQAAEAGQNRILKFWLEKGWSTVLGGNHILDRCLVSAVCGQHIETVKLLLSKGANVNIGKGQFATPLAFAAMRPNLEIVNLLLAAGADVDAADVERYPASLAKDDIFGWTPLMLAARYGHKNIVQSLLSHHANALHTSERGQTALGLAKQYNHADIVKLLSM